MCVGGRAICGQIVCPFGIREPRAGMWGANLDRGQCMLAHQFVFASVAEDVSLRLAVLSAVVFLDVQASCLISLRLRSCVCV